MSRLLFACLAFAVACLTLGHARAQQAVTLYCITGTSSTGAPIAQPATAATPCPVTTTTSGTGYTPKAATTSSVTTGGTAVTVLTGAVNGGFLTNPPNAASQGIATAENLYVDLVGTPGGTDSAANGTTVLLQPGQSFSIPGLASGVTLKANAVTSGHKFSVEAW